MICTCNHNGTCLACVYVAFRKREEAERSESKLITIQFEVDDIWDAHDIITQLNHHENTGLNCENARIIENPE